MKNELENLNKADYLNKKELSLKNCRLKNIPKEVFQMTELEFLDISGNEISEIPSEISHLKKLKIIFFSSNLFTVFPISLSNCQSLTMIGCKSNLIEIIPENSFPIQLQWLILTDNKIKSIPKSIGKLKLLQKLMLAGNQIVDLPEEMKNCKNLQLLRISANNIHNLPVWIWQFPKLAWLAYAGNPCSNNKDKKTPIKKSNWNDFSIHELLGEGASGQIYQCKNIKTKDDFAIKIYKGSITSDGLPENEIEAHILASNHPNIVKLETIVTNHPLGKKGILMNLLSKDFQNLGLPPTFETCTRDVFKKQFTFLEIKKILFQTLQTVIHLHKNQILHGDLYAHNILINSDFELKMGDFGAATIYNFNFDKHQLIEIRAFAFLAEDLIKNSILKTNEDAENKEILQSFINDCFNIESLKYKNFSDILKLNFLNK